jgi:hypothetical protein
VNFLKAKQEFQIRYYLWAISEWEKEANESFPNLRSFKSGAVWETYQFMRLLDKGEQLTLARALLKRFHSDAVKSLGEKTSPEEDSLRSRRDDLFRIRGFFQGFKYLRANGQAAEAGGLLQIFRADAAKVVGEPYMENDKSLLDKLDAIFQPIGSTFEEEIAARKKSGEKIRFAGKRKLQKAITIKFKDAFGDRCIDQEYDDICDPSSHFDMECCGWILRTNFWFGRGGSLINYSHTISSPTKISHERYPEITAPTMLMGLCISFSSWLGITSQVEWEYLFNEEVETVCDSVIMHCRNFIDVAPKLLKGLEFANITAD